jgi:hypothetical protein
MDEKNNYFVTLASALEILTWFAQIAETIPSCGSKS